MKLKLTALTIVATLLAHSALADEPTDRARLNMTNACEACDLSGEFFFQVNLSGANLHDAQLPKTDLTRANLSGANLSDANLWQAKLTMADLTDADLRLAYLGEANLSGADLTGAKITRAYMNGATLCNTTMPDGSVIYSGC